VGPRSWARLRVPRSSCLQAPRARTVLPSNHAGALFRNAPEEGLRLPSGSSTPSRQGAPHGPKITNPGPRHRSGLLPNLAILPSNLAQMSPCQRGVRHSAVIAVPKHFIETSFMLCFHRLPTPEARRHCRGHPLIYADMLGTESHEPGERTDPGWSILHSIDEESSFTEDQERARSKRILPE